MELCIFCCDNTITTFCWVKKAYYKIVCSIWSCFWKKCTHIHIRVHNKSSLLRGGITSNFLLIYANFLLQSRCYLIKKNIRWFFLSYSNLMHAPSPNPPWAHSVSLILIPHNQVHLVNITFQITFTLSTPLHLYQQMPGHAAIISCLEYCSILSPSSSTYAGLSSDSHTTGWRD